MLSRLGPNVWHQTPAAAMAVLEELEETAKLMQQATHPISPLSSKQIQELRETFGAKW
jgi:ribulose-5-phosphate 4-epimerase/fuculose-1-phosphate aldolase